jgi:hypothetical protein
MSYHCTPSVAVRRCEVCLYAVQLLLANPSFSGCRVFCSSSNAALDLGVVTRDTWDSASQQLSWTGSSFLMPGWRAAEAAHAQAGGEGGVVVVLTDGEAHDAAALCAALEKQLSPNLYVALCLLGEGPYFERARALFEQLSEAQPRVTVVRPPPAAGPAVALALEAAFSGSAWFGKELRKELK